MKGGGVLEDPIAPPLYTAVVEGSWYLVFGIMQNPSDLISL